MFTNIMDAEGNYCCNLCTGTVVSPEKKDLEFCQYLDQPVTEEFASRKFWMLPFEAFGDRMYEMERIIGFIKDEHAEDEIKGELISVIYAQLVTTFEVYFREKFKVGIINPKGFKDFVANYQWDKKYFPNELYGNMEQLVIEEMEKINFQNFSQVGNIFKGAFGVDIFAFPDVIKSEINRILRYRHSLIHQGEIWDNHHLIRLTISQLESDMQSLKSFIGKVDKEFERNIGTPYNELVEQGYFGSQKLPLGKNKKS